MIFFDIGYCHPFRGKGVRVVFNRDDQMDWFYAQNTLQFNLEINYSTLARMWLIERIKKEMERVKK